MDKQSYSVKKLAALAGVSVRTLHLYDEIGLLKPSVRTPAGYRLYSEKELLRLQHILFYKELDFPLKEIIRILDNPDFDILEALQSHKKALMERKERLSTLLNTIDKTILKMKKGMALTHKELYEGFPKEVSAYREQAIHKYGTKAVENSENYLMSLGKEGFQKLQKESFQITSELFNKMQNENPESQEVQRLIAKHYEVIRKLWGTHESADKQAEAYAGLGKLYVADERFTRIDGNPNPQFAQFMDKAMTYFASTL